MSFMIGMGVLILLVAGWPVLLEVLRESEQPLRPPPGTRGPAPQRPLKREWTPGIACWPLIFSNAEMLLVYKSIEELENDIDHSLDDESYGVGWKLYDAVGRKGEIAVGETTRQFQLGDSAPLMVFFGDWEPEPTHAGELERLIRNRLLAVCGAPVPADWSLEQLVVEASKRF